MIYVGFPYGSNFGWGVLGKEVTLALAEFTDVRLLSPPGIDQRLDDEVDLFRIQKLLVTGLDQTATNLRPQIPVIQAAVGWGLEPFVPGLPAPMDLAYAVFEESVLPSAVIDSARRNYRHIAAGSSYCAEVLRKHGLTEVSVVPHGVNTMLFCPREEPRAFLQDRFIVFSGGKFELRKGQDVVIRAYKVLQDRHRDVMLVNSWHNSWPRYRDTMASSAHIRYFPPRDNQYIPWMNALLAANGIDLDRVITVGPRSNGLLPALYHATDLGLFPNRIEGGNNMVLMEYLACGKPALVSYNSGHKDILRRQNAVLIECHKPMERREDDQVLTGVWNDPSLEETIFKLEWCYQNRAELLPLARQAAVDMRKFSWRHTARGLMQCIPALQATEHNDPGANANSTST